MSHVFAERLKQAREERGMSRLDFARRVGCEREMVWRYECAGVLPKLDSLVAIAQQLDRSLDWLCGLDSK